MLLLAAFDIDAKFCDILLKASRLPIPVVPFVAAAIPLLLLKLLSLRPELLIWLTSIGRGVTPREDLTDGDDDATPGVDALRGVVFLPGVSLLPEARCSILDLTAALKAVLLGSTLARELVADGLNEKELSSLRRARSLSFSFKYLSSAFPHDISNTIHLKLS